MVGIIISVAKQVALLHAWYNTEPFHVQLHKSIFP